jgi:RimJ/RimL family protein N-acetyltransferase
MKERLLEKNTNISHRGLPLFRDHLRFIENKPYKFWHTISLKKEKIGVVYSTKLNEIGIYIINKYRRKGYAKTAIVDVIDNNRETEFKANINPKNTPSIKLFESLGFKHIQNTYARGN